MVINPFIGISHESIGRIPILGWTMFPTMNPTSLDHFFRMILLEKKGSFNWLKMMGNSLGTTDWDFPKLKGYP